MRKPKATISVRQEFRYATALWGPLSPTLGRVLRKLLEFHQLSVMSGDVTLLSEHWYVTHPGLLRLASRHRCSGIDVRPVRPFCDPALSRWSFKATVFKSRSCRGFVGFGDADPTNVSPRVHGAEMRVAETRAVNRALRKAYGIGICSVEEIGSVDTRTVPERPVRGLPPQSSNGKKGHAVNGSETRVRDRLCQLIRHHRLDAELVKSYAVDFCGTKALRDASREQVENFVSHLADWAQKDRNALLCQLNSYQRRESTTASEQQAGAA